jgi:hypothetical protein
MNIRGTTIKFLGEFVLTNRFMELKFSEESISTLKFPQAVCPQLSRPSQLQFPVVEGWNVVS